MSRKPLIRRVLGVTLGFAAGFVIFMAMGESMGKAALMAAVITLASAFGWWRSSTTTAIVANDLNGVSSLANAPAVRDACRTRVAIPR